MTDDLNLGRLLGRREAFSALAARCSAAEAAQLKTIRDSRAFLNHAKDWKEFCEKFLHISDDTANRLIGLLERFGPAYFQVAQLTRISAKTYRAIAPSIHDEAIHYNGEAIPLSPENADRVAAAVADLRKAAEPPLLPAPSDPADPLPVLEKECCEVLQRIEAVIELRLPAREQLRAIVRGARDYLTRLEQTI